MQTGEKERACGTLNVDERADSWMLMETLYLPTSRFEEGRRTLVPLVLRIDFVLLTLLCCCGQMAAVFSKRETLGTRFFLVMGAYFAPKKFV